jgi:photoactive yellow protein
MERSSGNAASFESADLLRQLEKMNPTELDALDFGVVAMDLQGLVVHYNSAEARGAGLSPERVVGRHFFSAVAPCTNNYLVAQRFEAATELDEVIDYVFTLKMKPTNVKLRMLKSADLQRQFLAVRWR